MSEPIAPMFCRCEHPMTMHVEAGCTGCSCNTPRHILLASFMAPKPEIDPVNKPAHYNAGSIECIDAIRAALTPEEFRGYCKGNALKYTWREKHKGGAQDLEKAQWYLRKAGEK